jgi:hypothetical protein
VNLEGGNLNSAVQKASDDILQAAIHSGVGLCKVSDCGGPAAPAIKPQWAWLTHPHGIEGQVACLSSAALAQGAMSSNQASLLLPAWGLPLPCGTLRGGLSIETF